LGKTAQKQKEGGGGGKSATRNGDLIPFTMSRKKRNNRGKGYTSTDWMGGACVIIFKKKSRERSRERDQIADKRDLHSQWHRVVRRKQGKKGGSKFW